jgi:TolB-like protein/Flp pilus assembly protein TadD
MDPGKFFTELKRRNVYKVAAAYAVVAWLLIQAASIIFPTFEAPAWTMKILLAVLAIGFPVAVILAWAFELTPEGLVRSDEVAPDQSISRRTGRKLDFLIIGVLMVVITLLVTDRFWIRPPSSSGAGKSIAVLPFENLSSDKENAFFAQGIQGEILTSLTKISGLKVISRASTARYQSKPDNLSAIAAELRVAHVVEGTVQRSGERIRIHVQLIRAETNEHVWAESYDRTLTEIFALEGEIAKNVAQALHATLTPAENESLTRPPTENPEAYVFYLRGREYFERAERSREQYQVAAGLFEQAIALDPRFASAWALLSRTLINIDAFFETTPERKARALAAAEEALRVQPHSGEAHRALAAVYARTGDHERRLAELQLASRALPNDPEIITAMAYSLKALGKWGEARAACDRALALGPHDTACLFALALCARDLRDWPTAAATLDRLLAFSPDASNMKMFRAWIDFYWRGDLRPIKELLATFPPGTPDADGKIASARVDVALYEREYDVAEQVYAALPLDETSVGRSDNTKPKAFLQAIACLSRGGEGDAERAQTYLHKARVYLEAATAKNPGNYWAHADLGRVYANLGWRDAAVGEGLYAVELCPETKNAIDGVEISRRLAWIYAGLGDADAAIPLLDRLLRTPGGPYLNEVRADAEWDPIRRDPRFQALVAGPEPKTIYN